MILITKFITLKSQYNIIGILAGNIIKLKLLDSIKPTIQP